MFSFLIISCHHDITIHNYYSRVGHHSEPWCSSLMSLLYEFMLEHQFYLMDERCKWLTVSSAANRPNKMRPENRPWQYVRYALVKTKIWLEHVEDKMGNRGSKYGQVFQEVFLQKKQKNGVIAGGNIGLNELLFNIREWLCWWEEK